MSEEKELNEIEGEEIVGGNEFEDLENFVEFDDLENIEGLGDLSGLGDISDLGDLSDLPDADLFAGDNSDAEPAADVKEASDLSIDDVNEDLSNDEPEISLPEDMSFNDMGVPLPDEDMQEASLESDIEVPDIEVPDIEVPDIEVPDIDINIDDSIEEDTDTDLEDTVLEDIVSKEDLAAPDIDILPEDISAGDLAAPVMDEAGLAEEETEAVPDMPEVSEEEADVGEATVALDNDADSVDSMLDGILDNLDMDGSLEDETEVLEEVVPEPMGSADSFGDVEQNVQEETAVSGSAAAMTSSAGVAGGTNEPQESEYFMPEEEKKPGFFKRLFGNVITDEIAEAERQAKIDEEEEAAKKEEEAKAAKEEKEAKKAAAAEAKAAKKAEKDAKKAEKAEAKAAKKAEKAEAKAAKKAAEEEEAANEVVGKLNKAGVIVVVIFAAVFLVSVIAGTNIFGYKVVKSDAERYFELKKYNSAYEKAMGSKMQEKDPETYEKIITVMKVQQSLNAYSSYASVKHYPDALNALLRGLQNYDDNYDAAMELEIEDDLKSCKDKIVSILRDEYGLSEREAYSILKLDDEAYNDKVVSIAMKKLG